MKNVELVLTKDVPQLGRRGAVVNVTAGYARNYLLPRGLAVAATAGSKAAAAAASARAAKREAERRVKAEEVAGRLVNVALTFRKLSNENGELYGSLSAAEVAEALAAEGFEIDKRQISFDEPVSRLGLFAARVKLLEGVEVSVPVTVIRQEE